VNKILAFVSAISIILLLVGCGKTPKEDVFSLVEGKYDKIVAACEGKDADALLAIKGVTKVNIADGYVIVFCKGAGISASSQDYGFYYSEDNSPAAIGCNQDIVCTAEELTAQENGYQCTVSGDVFYTEHIKGNIYFYSNAY